jgi:predicted secreted protein
MGASTGRDVVIEFAIADEKAIYANLTFKELGMMRGKSIKLSWDTVDTTADKSPEFTKTSLVTFKSAEFSGDGVSYGEAAHNQKELKAHVYNGASAMGFQPKAWIRQTEPDGSVTYGPFIFTEWSSDAPYGDAVTWSTSATSNGAIVYLPSA